MYKLLAIIVIFQKMKCEKINITVHASKKNPSNYCRYCLPLRVQKNRKMIKKITPFLVVIMFLFVACNQNNTPKDKVDESEKTQCSLDYISQNDTNSYSVIKWNFPVYLDDSCLFCSIVNDSIKTYIYQETSLFERDSVDYRSFVKDSEGQFVELHLVANVEIDNDDYLSVKIQNYSYLLGAHGNSEHKFFTFKKSNCSILDLSDIIDFSIDNSDSLLNNLLVANFENVDNCFDSIPTASSDFEKFALTQKGVLFWYDAYELGAYACGSAEILIPYKELKAAKLLLIPSSAI